MFKHTLLVCILNHQINQQVGINNNLLAIVMFFKGLYTLAMILRQKCKCQRHTTIYIYAYYCHYCNCLGHLGLQDKNINDPISVAQPEVAKTSTILTAVCCCCQCYHASLCQWKQLNGV
jgi:hypothetical protein